MKKLLVIFFVFCATTLTYAQQDGSLRLFDTFEQRFVALDSLIFAPTEVDSAVVDSPAFYFQHYWIAQDTTNKADSLITDHVKAEVRAMKHETGLALTGQTYYRLDEGLALDEDDAVSRYKAKVQVELRWNFLNSSLIHRQGRKQAIELQGDMVKRTNTRTRQLQVF